MPDLSFGVTHVYGNVTTGYAAMSSGFEFISVSTAIPIYTFAQVLSANSWTIGSATADQLAQARASQAALDKLIQIISLRGQPVVMGATVLDTGVYTILMATEHPTAWQSTATASSTPSFNTVNTNNVNVFQPDLRTNEDLKQRIIADGVNFGFGRHVSIVFDDPIGGGTYTQNIDDGTALVVAYNGVLT
jgi:hypothetical protein